MLLHRCCYRLRSRYRLTQCRYVTEETIGSKNIRQYYYIFKLFLLSTLYPLDPGRIAAIQHHYFLRTTPSAWHDSIRLMSGMYFGDFPCKGTGR